MGTANTNGRMEVYTLVISKMDGNMVKANGKNNIMHKPVITMKEITRMTRKMATVFSNGRAATSIRVTTKMTKEMVMVKCIGLMVLFIKVNGEEESNMELEE